MKNQIRLNQSVNPKNSLNSKKPLENATSPTVWSPKTYRTANNHELKRSSKKDREDAPKTSGNRDYDVKNRNAKYEQPQCIQFKVYPTFANNSSNIDLK